MSITLPFPTVHGNKVIEASVEEQRHSQPGVRDLVQFTLVATGLTQHCILQSYKVRYNDQGGVMFTK